MQLLEYFNELSLHPKNAKELKGLILQLAVQGKLTNKWRKEHPDVEPASVLLERIEKDWLIDKKKIKKEKPLAPIGDEEQPFELSDSWVFTRLGVIIKISSGDGLTSANMDKEGSIPVYGGNGITGYHSKFNVNKPEIVIGRVGYYCGSIHLSEDKAWVTDNAFVTKFSEPNIYRDFLVWLLKATNLKEEENATAQPVISGRKVYPIVVGLPPLEEQKAIVEVVNQLFAEVDQLEILTKERIHLKEDFVTSALKQLSTGDTSTEWTFLKEHFSTFFTEKSNIKKLRESILQLAVQGKLTSDWRRLNPDVENAKVLLERIKKEKEQLVKEKKIKKENPLPKISEEEIPYELPEGWVWCRLGQTGYTQTGNTPPKNNPAYFGNFIPFIGPADISNNWMKYPPDGLSKEGIEVGRLIPKDSLLMVCIGGSIGKCNITEIEVSCNQQINTITPILNLPVILRIVCQSPYFQNEVWEKSSGSATPIINKGKWENITIPLPPLEEQKAIVKKVNSLMTLCDELEAEIERSKTTQEKWMESSLREVFEGDKTEY
jgi:type I restriction enzyme S subunit